MQIAPTTFNVHFRVEFLSICIVNIKQDVSCSSEDRGLHTWFNLLRISELTDDVMLLDN